MIHFLTAFFTQVYDVQMWEMCFVSIAGIIATYTIGWQTGNLKGFDEGLHESEAICNKHIAKCQDEIAQLKKNNDSLRLELDMCNTNLEGWIKNTSFFLRAQPVFWLPSNHATT